MTEQTKPSEYAIVNGWLVEVVDYHTCGTGPEGYYGMHEPGCGTIPLGKVEDILTHASKWYEAHRNTASSTPESDPLRLTIRTAIGYDPVPLSIRDHPEIKSEYRTAEDADGLVDRIETALRAEGYVRMAAIMDPDEDELEYLSTPPTTHQVEEIYIRHLLGGVLSTKQLRERFQAWLTEHDQEVRQKALTDSTW